MCHSKQLALPNCTFSFLLEIKKKCFWYESNWVKAGGNDCTNERDERAGQAVPELFSQLSAICSMKNDVWAGSRISFLDHHALRAPYTKLRVPLGVKHVVWTRLKFFLLLENLSILQC